MQGCIPGNITRLRGNDKLVLIFGVSHKILVGTWTQMGIGWMAQLVGTWKTRVYFPGVAMSFVQRRSLSKTA